MPTEVQIAETDEGRLTLRGNELLIIDKTSGDPCALRFRTSNETVGKITFDTFIEGAWREFGYISGKKDERGRTDPAHANAPEFEFWGHKPNAGWNDADYERLFAIRHDGVVFYMGGSVPAPKVTRFYTDHGQFCVNWQDDTGQAAGVVYNTHQSTDESTWTAVGRVKIDPL